MYMTDAAPRGSGGPRFGAGREPVGAPPSPDRRDRGRPDPAPVAAHPRGASRDLRCIGGDRSRDFRAAHPHAMPGRRPGVVLSHLLQAVSSRSGHRPLSRRDRPVSWKDSNLRPVVNSHVLYPAELHNRCADRRRERYTPRETRVRRTGFTNRYRFPSTSASVPFPHRPEPPGQRVRPASGQKKPRSDRRSAGASSRAMRSTHGPDESGPCQRVPPSSSDARAGAPTADRAQGRAAGASCLR